MRVVVIGLGSMGKRRIRLIRQFDESIQIVGVDTRDDRRQEVEENFNVMTYASMDEAIFAEKPQAAFICTSPERHPEITQRCLDLDLNIFSEINLVDKNHNELIKTAEDKNLILFLSSTFLYRREILYISEKVRLESIQNRKLHYIYHIGQYLPDWHPWESYEEFFVNNKETNGCREILAIELPWIIKSFGGIKAFTVKTDSISDLALNYPDSYIIILEHDNGNTGLLHVDVVSRQPVRNLEIISGGSFVSWNGKPDGLYEYSLDQKKMIKVNTYHQVEKDIRYAENIIENAYMDEIVAFFGALDGDQLEVRYDMRKEKKVLKIIDEIEGK